MDMNRHEPAERNDKIWCCHEASVGLFWRQVRLSHQALFKSRPAEGNTSIVFSKARPRVHPFFGSRSVSFPWWRFGITTCRWWRIVGDLCLLANSPLMPVSVGGVMGCGGWGISHTLVSHTLVHWMQSNSFPFHVVHPMQCRIKFPSGIFGGSFVPHISGSVLDGLRGSSHFQIPSLISLGVSNFLLVGGNHGAVKRCCRKQSITAMPQLRPFQKKDASFG